MKIFKALMAASLLLISGLSFSYSIPFEISNKSDDRIVVYFSYCNVMPPAGFCYGSQQTSIIAPHRRLRPIINLFPDIVMVSAIKAMRSDGTIYYRHYQIPDSDCFSHVYSGGPHDMRNYSGIIINTYAYEPHITCTRACY